MTPPRFPDRLDIRPARQEDLPSIAGIYAESVLTGVSTYEIVPPSLDEMAQRFAANAGNGYPWLVGEADGRIAGYAYASAFRTRPAYRWMVEDSIYLAADMQGVGLGKMMLGRLVDACERLGFRQVVAVIGGAHPASIGVHRSLGFMPAGRIAASGYKFGRWLDTVFMQRALGEGDSTLPDEKAYPGTLFGG